MFISFNEFTCTCDILVSAVHYITAASTYTDNDRWYSSDKGIISKLADAQNKIFFSALWALSPKNKKKKC
jgi:hypothetical protein